MEWIINWQPSWIEWVAIKVLKVGPLPKHLAVIMDGNRRYARLFQKDTLEGHKDGFKKLTEVLSWCRHIGINEVTAYAFSIENFKRPKHEVEGLMSLAEEKFKLLLEQCDKFEEYGVKINAIGNLNLLSLNMKKLAAQAIHMTKDNDQFILNLAIAYTSREEICNAMKELRKGVQQQMIAITDIDKNLLESCLYTSKSNNPPDLLIRTSGEVRLSDFLLWQTEFTHLSFTKVLWPELNIWHIFGAVFHYQRYYHIVRSMKQIYPECKDNATKMFDSKEEIKIIFLKDLEDRRLELLNSRLTAA